VEHQSIWQWIVGGFAAALMSAQAFISRQLHQRVTDLENSKADSEHIDRRIDELTRRVEQHDMRNAAAHGKVYDGIGELRERLARIEGKVDTIHRREGDSP
jgi:hypothetical protein